MNRMIVRWTGIQDETSNKLINLHSDLHQEHTPHRLSPHFAVLYMPKHFQKAVTSVGVSGSVHVSYQPHVTSHTHTAFWCTSSQDEFWNVSTVVGSSFVLPVYRFCCFTRLL